MVIPDDGKTRFPLINAEGRVTADPDQIIGALVSLAKGEKLSLATNEALTIMNFALMNTQPIAQIVLALSAVEALGQDERWTDAQRFLIQELAKESEQMASCSLEERLEVADAMRRSLHRIGLRQGVLRVLTKLGLTHLKYEWDRIYGARSALFHGLDRLEDGTIAQLAIDAITLGGTIVLTLAKQEGVVLPDVAVTHFPQLGQ